MKTEYILSDAQKKKIAELRQQIFKLEMQIAAIYVVAPIRYITETEEEYESVRKYRCFTDKLLQQGVVNIKAKKTKSNL